MSSDAIKSIAALFVALLITVGLLIKFDKMPGVHLGGAGGVKFGFDTAVSQDDGAGSGGDGQSVKADELRFGGFSGPPRRRMAIINNRTFAEGEAARLVCGATNVNVRCVEIRTSSILVQREDVAALIELFLGEARPKLYAVASGTNAIQQTNLQVQAVLPDRTAPIEMLDVPTQATQQAETTNSPAAPAGG